MNEIDENATLWGTLPKWALSLVGFPETRAAVALIDPDLLGDKNANPSCPDLTSADRSGSNSFESTPMVVTWTLETIPALRTKMRKCSQLRPAAQCEWLLLFRPRAAMNLPTRGVSSRSTSSKIGKA